MQETLLPFLSQSPCFLVFFLLWRLCMKFILERVHCIFKSCHPFIAIFYFRFFIPKNQMFAVTNRTRYSIDTTIITVTFLINHFFSVLLQSSAKLLLFNDRLEFCASENWKINYLELGPVLYCVYAWGCKERFRFLSNYNLIRIQKYCESLALFESTDKRLHHSYR